MSETPRTIRVEALARVEGEGALNLRVRDGKIEAVELNIYEPPRLFEALLRGRALEEVPDITARICGICPVAYQMSSVHALERALGVTVSPELRQLRRLLYCGEWIESHALHVHLLHVPDFLGYDSGLAMAADFPDEVQRGLRLKKHGSQLLDVLGGRAVHPINVAVGGFYRVPRASELAALVPDFEWGLQAAINVTRWVSDFDFPTFERPYDFVALSHPDEYAMCEGNICTSDGLAIDAAQFAEHFREQQVPHSTALQAVRIETGATYLVGPLARVQLNRRQLMSEARQLADDLLERSCANPFKSIVARGIEIVHAYEEALSILRGSPACGQSRMPYDYREGDGAAATEAPRGLLYHRYRVDAEGRVAAADIVPPTSQNQGQIEDDLRHFLPAVIDASDDEIADAAERLVRSYDPCISCATHFLRVKVERQ
ncbi:MAG: Ni/Fe hydrogenase subunit alpha [Planctomycetota bacterium]|nr:MAG: Ni/Fe hydrogenase subunit alpha [Planctomycetota bacterium]